MSKSDIRGLLDKAIAIAGSQRALAAACRPKYTQNAIHQARKLGRVSPRMAGRIARALDGVISARQLCPDVDWPD